MHSLRFCVLFGILLIGLQVVSGLRCYSCNNVDSNDKCRRTTYCRGGATSCENVVRMENGMLRISKGCQQLQACRDSSKQNQYLCSPSVRSLLSASTVKVSRSLPPSVCRSCCTGNNCNRKLFLQEARSRPARPGQSQWRSVLPSIRNVKVTTLSSGTALITFTDTKKHSSDFFNVRLTPGSTTVNPVVLINRKVPGFKLTVPNGYLAYLATGLSAGVQYSISVVSKEKNRWYAQRIYTTFVTKPRPPSRIRVMSATPTTITVSVDSPRFVQGDRVSYYGAEYRRVVDSIRLRRRIPNTAGPGQRIIKNLQPSTQYVIKAWTNVVDRSGRRIASSKPINITAYTGVPGLENIRTREVHATSITWSFGVPSFARGSQDSFVASVRDITMGRLVGESAIATNKRSYIGEDLTPGHTYRFSIRATAGGRESAISSSRTAQTVIRCYSCDDARSPNECSDHVECPPQSSGCYNEVQFRAQTNGREGTDFYRSTMRCKQSMQCNTTENLIMRDACSRSNSANRPDVCSCCCNGDLCNGAGSDCGHVFNWLGIYRAPESIITPPPFCPALETDNGRVSCSNELEIGSSCTFECIGDRYVVGEKVLNCFENGQWSAPVPKCELLETCPDIPTPPGTNVDCSNGFKARSTCRIRCDKGYVNPGEGLMQCSHSRRWSETFIPQCLLIDYCQPDPCVNGATCHPVAADYECQCVDGFTGKNCSEGVVCETLVAPENGQLQCTNSNKYLSRCRYSCDVGYEQHGSTFTRCLTDGFWSAYEPTLCVVKSCPVPAQRLVNEGRTHCSGFEYGDTCNFTCPPGLSVAGGPASISCQADETWTENVPCCDLQCPPHARVDLYILLDSSSSVGKTNWKILINFTIAVLDQFVVGSNDMRVGVGRYNRRFDDDSEILFGEYKDYDDLKYKLRSMPYNGRGTKTGAALRHVYAHSFNAPGNRKDVPDMLIVITDGRSKDDVIKPATLIKSNKDTRVYAVGVLVDPRASVNRNQLDAIASGPQYVHVITEGYEQLAQNLSATLTEDVCWIPCEFQYGLRELFLRQRQLAAMTGDEVDAEFWSNYDLSNVTTASPTTSAATTRMPIPIEPTERERGPAPIEEESERPAPIEEERERPAPIEEGRGRPTSIEEERSPIPAEEETERGAPIEEEQT